MFEIIISLDTETYEWDEKEGHYKPILDARKFILGCAKTDTGETIFFQERKKMWEWLIEKIEKNAKNGKRTYIYAHNMEYDFYAIAQDQFLNPDIKYIIFNPFLAIYKEKGYFLDTMAFYRTTLKNVGKILHCYKKEMPNNPKHIMEIYPYLERDTEIVLKAILKVKENMKKLGYNPRKLLTAGQLSISSFMTHAKRNGTAKTFMEYNKEKNIYQIIKSKRPHLIRRAFRGGRNEAYQLGKFENCTLIDINALYPHIMMTMDFPKLETERYMQTNNIKKLKKEMEGKIGVAQITIQAPNIELPYLPIRYAEYITYPRSCKLKGVWTFTEIQKAQKLGYKIEEVEWLITFQKAQINPLQSFIKELYEIKQKVGWEEQGTIKLIMNNLYGKFGQYKENKDYKIIERYKVQELTEKGYRVISTHENKYIMVKNMEAYDPSYTNVIISTQITALARDRLYDELKKIPNEDRLYTDTDSIMYKGDWLNKFNISKKIGDFKVENKGTAKILGEKRYYIQENVKISGLSKRDQTKETIEQERAVNTLKMIGLKDGLKGKIQEIGSFKKETKEMTKHNKAMIPIPEIITEVY